MSNLIEDALDVIKDGAEAITSLVRAFEYLNDIFGDTKKQGEKTVIAPNEDIKAEHDNARESQSIGKRSPPTSTEVVETELDSTGVYRVARKKLVIK